MDKLLFTPGPLSTSLTVKEAMLRDLGSRDGEFIETVANVRNKILAIAGLKKGQYEVVIMQGSGTFAVESVISSAVPDDGALLVIINGAYGRRIEKIAKRHKLNVLTMEYPENTLPDCDEISRKLLSEESITHVAVVHCETTTGIVNPIEKVGKIAASCGKKYIVDAMSSFGAVPIDFKESEIDFLISSSNKCIQGVPGFAFVISRAEALRQTVNNARTLSLDLFDQFSSLENTGQFRFTPPVQVILSFNKALDELVEEGGIAGRAERYKSNYEVLVSGMEKLGFKPYINEPHRGYIITSFLIPDDPKFSFKTFYDRLNKKGFVIYPGKLSSLETFRIGHIGDIYIKDMEDLLEAVEETLYEMEVKLT